MDKEDQTLGEPLSPAAFALVFLLFALTKSLYFLTGWSGLTTLSAWLLFSKCFLRFEGNELFTSVHFSFSTSELDSLSFHLATSDAGSKATRALLARKVTEISVMGNTRRSLGRRTSLKILIFWARGPHMDFSHPHSCSKGGSLFHFLSHIKNWKLCRVTSVQTEVSPASVRTWITDVCRRHCDMALHRRKPSEKKTGRGLSSWLKSLQSEQADHMSNQSTLTGNCRTITVLIFYSWRPHCPMVCTREHLLLIFGFCVWYPGFKKSLEKKLINFPGFLYFPCFVKRLPWFGACGDFPEIDCLFSCSSCWRSARRKVSTDCTLRAFIALCLAGVVARGSLKISFQIQLSLFWP